MTSFWSLTRVDDPWSDPQAQPWSRPGPVCAAGLWVTHEEWPGWQYPCGEPGEVCPDVPFLLCLGHRMDLAARRR
jgi:hypothetical protein